MVPGGEIFKESSEVSFLLAWAWVVLAGPAVVRGHHFDSAVFPDDAMDLEPVLACGGNEKEDGGE